MALFGLGKRKEEQVKENTCCNASNCSEDTKKVMDSANDDLSVKVLGSGCAKCNELEANVRSALEQLGMDTTIEHVTDFGKIAQYGVMTTPAIVIDGKVVSYGKVLKVEEVVKILEKIR
jgi:small redox-active disulfide protein 2